ncbi:hypothetical protein ACO22_00223 [Paracoccidioides brasiliensis]|uniref:Fungal N-terminal domain-containing protein n=1 Tax=Paracoccidioides brasiliensis TaxID=121759 RepID=A0A1D2JPV3_PARBR|nr:hypothetical protein ACO22_00223 [Paracoccidioides brasiliensis]
MKNLKCPKYVRLDLPPQLTETNGTSDTIRSILHVAGSGFRLSLMLNAVACEVASAGVDVHSIGKGLSLYAMSLKQITHSFQAMDSLHSSEALNTAREISEQSRAIFEDLEIMLEKVQQDNGGLVQERFKRCFRKQHVSYLLAHLESLKLSLMLMFQVLQLGKLTSSIRNASNPLGNDFIQQERAETQNMVIVRYWSVSRLERLYELAAREAMEYNQNQNDSRLSNPQPNSLGLQPPSSTPTKLSVISLGNLDTSLTPINQSPKDMLRVSSDVIEPLINRWTRLEERWELPAGQFKGSLRVLLDSESEFEECGDESDGHGIQGYYLEGTTSDWRKPNSQEARKHAAELRKGYSKFQARVDSDTDTASDIEKQPTKRKVRFAPSGNTSASETGTHRQGHDEQVGADNGRSKHSPSQLHIPIPQVAVYAPEQPDIRSPSSPSHPHSMPRSIPQQRQPQRYSHTPPSSSPNSHPRPFGSSPSQHHHANQHLSSSPHSPKWPSSSAPATNIQSHSPRAPAPHTHAVQSHHHSHQATSRRSNNNSGRQSRHETPAKEDSSERRRNLKRSAAAGILGAGAITTFLEALEGFSI